MTLRRKLIWSCAFMLVIPLVYIALLTAAMFFIYGNIDPAGSARLFAPWERVRETPPPLFVRMLPVWAAMVATGFIAICVGVTLYIQQSILPPLRDLRRAAGRIREGDLDFEVLSSPISEIDALCRSFDDMRKRLKEGVLTSLAEERSRSLLTASLSHDLRTPVTSVKGYVEGILDGVADTPEKIERYLRTIQQKVSAMERLLDDMSALSELELGQMRFNFEICDIIPLLRGLLEEYWFELAAEGADLQMELPKLSRRVMVDSRKIRRVFQNIISNALKYRGDQPLEIKVSAEAEDGGVRIAIKDNGKGIQEGELSRIFESFYRGDPSRNGIVSGHGLGLSISKQIIERHHGRIWLESALSEGTTVYIFLPFRDGK